MRVLPGLNVQLRAGGLGVGATHSQQRTQNVRALHHSTLEHPRHLPTEGPQEQRFGLVIGGVRHGDLTPRREGTVPRGAGGSLNRAVLVDVHPNHLRPRSPGLGLVGCPARLLG